MPNAVHSKMEINFAEDFIFQCQIIIVDLTYINLHKSRHVESKTSTNELLSTIANKMTNINMVVI